MFGFPEIIAILVLSFEGGFSSPPEKIKFYLLTTVGGAKQTAARARGSGVVGHRPKVKIDKAMKYDLFAEFYENSSEKPRYVVWMGSIYPKSLNEMESMGFQERLNDGYLDYVKENVTENDLEELTQPGFECELMDVIEELDMFDEPDEVYNERVKIIATELDVIDDEGNYPEMEYMVGDTMVSFSDTSAMCPVLFRRLPDCVEKFMVSVVKLKRHFKVLTLMEVIEALQAMNAEKEWTFEQLKELFYKEDGEPMPMEQKIEPVLIEDLVAVAVDGKSILFVREQDKENVQAVGVMVETDNSMCCQFGLVQHFLKFRMMDIVQDKADLHEYYRTRITQTFQLTAINNLETEFRRQLAAWDSLENKWDFTFSKVFW